jgi:sugar/nucleoside kinase (ribokinase family)
MKKFDVYGIGNALVDIVTEVDGDFFNKNQIEKGVMTLVDENRQHQLMKAIDMNRSKMSCGGSAGNTVIAVNQFGGKSFYSCLVAKDDLGKFFLEDLKRNGVSTNLMYENCPEGITGKCLVMTTSDADRTMNTFLGISSFLSPDQLDEDAIKNSSYIYLEGYLVPSPKKVFIVLSASEVVMTTSDADRTMNTFLGLGTR